MPSVDLTRVERDRLAATFGRRFRSDEPKAGPSVLLRIVVVALALGFGALLTSLFLPAAQSPEQPAAVLRHVGS